MRSPTKAAAAAAALCATTASAFHPPDVVGNSHVAMRGDPNPYGSPTPAPRPAPRPTVRRKKTARKMSMVDVNEEKGLAPNTQDVLRGAVAVGLLGVGSVAWVQEFLATQAPGLALSAPCLLGGWAALVTRVTGGVPDDFYDASKR